MTDELNDNIMQDILEVLRKAYPEEELLPAPRPRERETPPEQQIPDWIYYLIVLGVIFIASAALAWMISGGF